MPSLAGFHVVLGRSFMFFSLAMGLWGMFSYLRGQPPGPSYWGALVIGEAVAVSQALIGITRLVGGGQPRRFIHFLYGALTVVLWPAIFGYLRGQEDTRTASLAYGLGSLFLFGITLRAACTALPAPCQPF